MGSQSDPRFARLHTDPRFRRPKQKSLKVELDDRFRDVLESEEFGGKGKGKGKGKSDNRVDNRGRPLTATHHADQLKRFYRVRSKSPEAESEFIDYARGEGALPSSGSEDEDEGDESSDEEEELELGGERKVPRFDPLNIPNGEETEEDSGEDEEDEDEENPLEVDLSEDEDSKTGLPAHVGEAEQAAEDDDDEPYAEPTKRIAAVNLDWDNLRAADLFAVFNSFLTTQTGGDGRLLHVRIYPSEFGKERMEQEEREGPGGGIFAARQRSNGTSKHKSGSANGARAEESEDDEEDHDFPTTVLEDIPEGSEDEDEDLQDVESSDNEDALAGPSTRLNGTSRPLKMGKGTMKESKEIDGLEIISDMSSDDGDGDINMDQLRQYQIERLRYFYAVATFSSVKAAMQVVSECNGTEFERTANVLDLSYVPDDMEFAEEDVTDEATKETKGYKGNDFVTDALRHSKVKLTWDQDDPNRIKVTRRNLTREQLEEDDMAAYIASSGSDDERTASDGEGEQDLQGNGPVAGSSKESTSRKEALRGLLLNGDDEFGDVWGKAGRSNYRDLDVDGSDPSRKNGEMEITFNPGLSDAAGGKADEQLTTLERYQMRVKEKKARKKEKIELRRATKSGNDDDGSQDRKDDFFGDDESDDLPPAAAEGPGEMEEEDLVVGGGHHVDHFSMKDILKAEKGESKGKKRKRSKKKGKDGSEREIELGKEGWKIDTKDDRFKALHEEPDFAIDPSNPRFIRSKGMEQLLADGQRSRKGGARLSTQSRPEATQHEDDTKLGVLVDRAKRRREKGHGSRLRP